MLWPCPFCSVTRCLAVPHRLQRGRRLTAGQHDDPGASASIPEHLAQTLFLVGPQHSGGLQVDVDVGVDRVVAKVVLGQEGVLQLNAALLQVFDHLLHPIGEEPFGD